MDYITKRIQHMLDYIHKYSSKINYTQQQINIIKDFVSSLLHHNIQSFDIIHIDDYLFLAINNTTPMNVKVEEIILMQDIAQKYSISLNIYDCDICTRDHSKCKFYECIKISFL